MPSCGPIGEVRIGGPDDDVAVAELLAAAATGNPKADVDVLRWQYRREEFGPTVTAVAELDGRLIAHYSLVGVPLVVDGRPVVAARGVDIVTAVDHRRQGIFRRVAVALFDAGRAMGYQAVVSNPNDSSIEVLGDLGFTACPDPQVHVVPVSGDAVAGRLPMPHALGAAAVALLGAVRGTDRPAVGAHLLDAAPGDLDVLDGTLVPSTGVVRDSRWWRWRYDGHPHRPYRFVEVRRRGRLIGAGAWSVRADPDGDVVQLLECVGVDDDARRQVVRSAVAAARAIGAGAVVSAALPRSVEALHLRRAGFVPVPRALQPRPIHMLVAPLGGWSAEVRRPWAFHLGDQDHL
ncbi:MAG: GNAT family N-acetyltransferase [Acidimicrobiia bacterium]|nr:GNAT family N-acetyltransferase [Acidimicrobiia bacterium]